MKYKDGEEVKQRREIISLTDDAKFQEIIKRLPASELN